MSSPNPNEEPCPDCGEMVRVNSVRCWNCGAFMNRELEVKYQEMQANPNRIILSEIPQDDIQSAGDDDDDEGYQLSVQSSDRLSTSTPAPALPPEPAPVEEKPATEQPPKPSESAPAVSHSVATGGDALLDIARQEEAEAKQRRKGRKLAGVRTAGGGFVVFCPYGCKIEVKESHRGKTGRCPKCQAPFIVPVDPPMFKKVAAEKADASDAAAASGEKSTELAWMNDLHVHVVNLEKLKLKADSLAKEFVEADFGFLKDKLVVTILAKKAGGLFGGGADKKKAETREAVRQHVADGKPLEELPAAQKYVFSVEQLSELKVVQPAASRSDSMFHGIPVFGEGRIAIQLPFTEDSKEPLYVSMGITQFWEFVKVAAQTFDLEGLGADCGIPPEHVHSEYKCHYTDTPIHALENIAFYKADPTVELVVAGYRCGACGLTVSETGRSKEKLGGKSPKGIAKAKCPKCSQKMGENLLYTLKSEVEEPSMTEG